MGDKKLRWVGRNSEKDALRARMWSTLEESGVGRGKLCDSIPDFNGAEDAAERLAQTPFWKAARVVKSNPDNPQIPVRHRALCDGKLLYMPVPELAKEYPFVLLDPEVLRAKGVDFMTAAQIEGALTHGQRVKFTEMQPMDVLVVGCVAVSAQGGRTGKGAGFADLELGIFQELDLIPANGQLVTTVADLQLVESELLPIQSHDFPLDWIITPTKNIETKTSHPRPEGVTWNAVRSDQYENIPFLQQLRTELESR